MGVLVRAHIENAGILFEQMLGAIAVVYIPVNDENFFEIVLVLQVAGGNRDVVKKTKPQRGIVLGMVTGWANECEAVIGTAVCDFIGQVQDRACGKAGNIKGLGRNGDVGRVEIREALFTTYPCPLDQFPVVDTGEPFSLTADHINGLQ